MSSPISFRKLSNTSSRIGAALTLAASVVVLSGSPASAQSTNCGIAPAGYNVITSDDPVILGTQGDDFICAGSSANFIRSKGGDDIIHAGGGADTIKSGGGADLVYAGPGQDLVRGGAGGDTIDGGSGDDLLIGQGGNDTIIAMAGADVVRGKKGNDTIDGRGGNDILRGDLGDDTIYGDANDDILIGGPGNDELHGGGGNDELYGGANDDILDGGTDDDIVNGGNGTDTITGGSGSNTVDGGPGTDNCALFGTQANCETTDTPTGPVAPVATDDMVVTDEDSPITISVVANDTDANGDALTITNVTNTGPALVLPDSTTGTISFDPTGTLDNTPEGGSTIETFTYEISDGTLTDTATVTVLVIGANDAPKAANDLVVTADGSTPVDMNVLDNDFDIDGDVLSIFGTPSGGSGYPGGAIIIEPTGTAPGTIRWDASDAANGGNNAYTPVDGDVIKITYTVIDPHGAFDTGTFEITIAL